VPVVMGKKLTDFLLSLALKWAAVAANAAMGE
jgi:hypothetical protein